MTDLAATACIVGGGPAGIVLRFLLARAGVDVVVSESHSDFNRDFRGDTPQLRGNSPSPRMSH